MASIILILSLNTLSWNSFETLELVANNQVLFVPYNYILHIQLQQTKISKYFLASINLSLFYL
jgi:hypothetical protein